MKIALTLPHLPLSGIGTSVGIIEKGLTEAGYKVDIIITGHKVGNDSRFAEQSRWSLKVPGRGVRFLPHRLKRLVEILNLNKYSILINNTSAETQLILPCLRPDLLRIGVMRVLNQNALSHLAMNSVYLHAVVGISAEMTQVMSADERIKSPVKLIPNCTTLKGGEFPKLCDPLRICYIGRLSNPDKNVSILSRIAEIVKASGINFSLIIAGDGPARKMLENDFKRLAPSCVSFKGLVAREQAWQIMSHSQFVLLPSISEGLSNVMLEGMALGCVPICSDIENFKWVLGKTANHLQCRLNMPEDYAQRITYFINNPDVYRATQLYLRERQRNHFSPEHTVRGYLDLINELRSGRARKLPSSCDYETIEIPKEYRIYCSPVWRIMQKAKDMLISHE